MASNKDRYIPSKYTEDQKIPLLNTVSRKVVEMTKELPGLNILDFHISKTEKRVTLSIGFKKDTNPQQKFNLSNLFVHDPERDTSNMPKHKDFQHGQGLLKIHDTDCPCSTNQDKEALDKDEPKHRMPLTNRPEFGEKKKSTSAKDTPDGLDKMQTEIVNLITGISINSDGEDDGAPAWFDTFLKMDVTKMDEDYFRSLLTDREAKPDDQATQRRIDDFVQNNFKPTGGNDIHGFREFIPGKPWLSREEREIQEYNIMMDEVESSIAILKTKIATLNNIYDVLDKAVTCGREGRNLARDIEELIKHQAKVASRNRGMKEEVQIHAGQTDREKARDIQLREARKKMSNSLIMTQQRYEEFKAALGKKKEEIDNKKEEQDNKYENYGSFGSTLFSY